MALDLAPRSYLIALDCGYSEIKSLEETVVQSLKENKAHLHGLLVLKKKWLLKQMAYEDPPKFISEDKRGIEDFYVSIVGGIQSMPMLAAAISKYIA